MFLFERIQQKSHERFISPNTVYSRLKSNYLSLGYFIGRIVPYEIFSLSNIPLYHKSKPMKSGSPKIKNIILIMGKVRPQVILVLLVTGEKHLLFR